MSVVTQTREVHGFDQVTLRDYGVLDIVQGDQESLTVEASQDAMVDIHSEVQDGKLVLSIGETWIDKLRYGLKTSLTRPVIRYHLRVKHLTSLTLAGAGHIRAEGIHADSLVVRIRGAGEINLDSLEADSLEVLLPGAGIVSASGRVGLQSAVVEGAGAYQADKLESQKAIIKVRGAATATIWVQGELEATIEGIGGVRYYGHPKVTQNVRGLGSVVGLGSR